MEEGVKSSSKLSVDLFQSPPISVIKQEHTLSRSKSGAKSEQKQELISRNRQASIQAFVDTPPRTQGHAFSFITFRQFEVDYTTTRLEIFTSVLLLTIGVLSIVTAAIFWITVIISLMALFTWRTPGQMLYDLIIRWLSDSPVNSPIWQQLYLGSGSDGLHLRLAVHFSSYLNSPVIYSIMNPVVSNNPWAWLFVIVFMFTSHYLLCFAYGCLSKLSLRLRLD